MGIGLVQRARGRGHGTQAHRLLADYSFAHTVHRIDATTETGNIAEQKALERAEFRRVLLLAFTAATVKADRQRGGSVSHVAIVARVTVKEGRAGEYVAAFEPLLEQARQEPGTLLYALHRSKDDPHVFWTTEVYADDAAFAAHGASDVHAAASPVFTELIAAADVLIGETLIATGLGG